MKKWNFLHNLSIRQLFFIINAFTIIVLVSTGLMVINIQQLEDELTHINERRNVSYLLADEFRQNTDDLTRLARSYVVTHDSRYENYYWDVVAIRSGTKPRPENYHRIYWDLYISTGKKPRPDQNSAVSIQKLMEDAGFTKDELMKLREAEQNSNSVTQIEKTAMDAVKRGLAKQRALYTGASDFNSQSSTLLPDSLGNIGDSLAADSIRRVGNAFSLDVSQTDFTSAIKIMHDDVYNAEKAKIMKPLDEFLQMVAERAGKQVDEQANIINTRFIILYVLIIIIIAIIFLTYLIIKQQVTVPIERINNNIKLLSQGIIPRTKIEITNNNEIAQMAAAFNAYVEGLSQTVEFANRIGKGELNSQYMPLSKDDELGVALLEMQESLKKADEEDNRRRVEEDNRAWSSQGLAKFGDILRQSTENIRELSYNVVSNLINYLKANLGGLFIVNDDDKSDIHLELIAAYAYDRKKFIIKKIKMKEGLVGTCAMERRTIYLTKLPQDYIEITSGLGEASPRCLLLVPLIREDSVLGVIEIASFNELQKHEIEFVEKLADTIAATLASAKINARTAELLRQSQMQAEALAAQEEEMRQNMEELQATQEEAARKEAEAMGFVNAVNHTNIRANFDLEGHLVYANTKFLSTFGYTTSEVEGKNITMFLQESDIEWFEEHWSGLVEGGKHFERNVHFKTKYDTLWLLATFTSVRDRDGNIKEFLFLAFDITEMKRQEVEIKRLLDDSKEKTDLLVSQEEEMKQTMEDMLAAKHEMENQKKALEETNEKMRASESVLHKALQKARDNEIKLKEKSEELLSSEEELRQNLEELQVTQESIASKDAELTSILTAVHSASYVMEYDLNTRILDANDSYLLHLNAARTELVGKLQQDINTTLKQNKAMFDELWNEIKQGNTRKIISQINYNQKELWLSESYSPVFDKDNKIVKILSISSDISEMKRLEIQLKLDARELQAQEEELRQNLEMVSFAQQEMDKKREELENANQKLQENQKILQEAIDKANERENQVHEMNSQLLANEEELRQQMEEMNTIQDQLRQSLEQIQQSKEEMENIRITEQERADLQIKTQSKMMEKTLNKYKEKQAEIQKLLDLKEQEISELKQKLNL